MLVNFKSLGIVKSPCVVVYIDTERINENYQKQNKLQYTSIILDGFRAAWLTEPVWLGHKNCFFFANVEFVTMS